MKIRVVALSTLVFLAASFPVPAKKNPVVPFFLQSAVTMNGAEIPGGMYELSLESSSSSVEVTLWKDSQFVAAAHGTWVKGGVKYTENAVLLRVNPDGTRSLIEIRLAGAAKSIVLDRSDPILRLSSKR